MCDSFLMGNLAFAWACFCPFVVRSSSISNWATSQVSAIRLVSINFTRAGWSDNFIRAGWSEWCHRDDRSVLVCSSRHIATFARLPSHSCLRFSQLEVQEVLKLQSSEVGLRVFFFFLMQPQANPSAKLRAYPRAISQWNQDIFPNGFLR